MNVAAGGLDALMNVTFPAVPGWDVSGVVEDYRDWLEHAGFRVDLAVPMDRRPGDSAYQIYVSIGQSF